MSIRFLVVLQEREDGDDALGTWRTVERRVVRRIMERSVGEAFEEAAHAISMNYQGLCARRKAREA